MNARRITNLIFFLMLLSFASGVGAFVYNAKTQYTVNQGFEPVPLQFNPDDASSSHPLDMGNITVRGGFIKGFQRGKDGITRLVIRALSPLPKLELQGTGTEKISFLLENVNPEFYAKSIESYSMIQMEKTAANTLQLSVALNLGEELQIEPQMPKLTDGQNYNYVILGDNRDGYATFSDIIQQINRENPIFVIDNGDLVFSGKPNQYRLFDKTVAKISTTLCTTLGNHDMRGKGRTTYTMLYGPAYYSFDFGDSHFAFLDSAPGWSEKQAITDEQYLWLEKDLQKAQGKRIFVITHIPPTDPRGTVSPNEVPNYVDDIDQGKSWLERKLDNYSETKSMAHGFQDPKEAAKFETLMSQYHVDSVYLSHIHSYLEYKKDGVRYIITGGAGAELLSENSYYHYIVESIDHQKPMTIMELPSPANTAVARALATIKLFAVAMYDENPLAVVLILGGFVLLIFAILLRLYFWKKPFWDNSGHWLKDIARFSKEDFQQRFRKKE